MVKDPYGLTDQNCLLVWQFLHLNSKKIHKTNRNLQELKNKAIKKQELQELSDEEGKNHSETQSEKDTVSLMEKIWETIEIVVIHQIISINVATVK